MSSNRVQYFIRNILQNTKLNRDKFIKNKKIYNDLYKKNTNHNLILKRKLNTSCYGLQSQNNNNDNNQDNNNWIIFGYTIVTYINSGKFDKKNKIL